MYIIFIIMLWIVIGAIVLGLYIYGKIQMNKDVSDRVQSYFEEEERIAEESREKKCPECAEYVKYQARKCKHCGYLFDDDEDD